MHPDGLGRMSVGAAAGVPGPGTDTVCTAPEKGQEPPAEAPAAAEPDAAVVADVLLDDPSDPHAASSVPATAMTTAAENRPRLRRTAGRRWLRTMWPIRGLPRLGASGA